MIDGRRLLYKTQAGKIQNPNIPTDGLICYLDARGKTNTDKHKGILLDLSGNGNDGTLAVALGVELGVGQEQVVGIVGVILTILTGLGILVDPTTKGIEDSHRAMNYTEPK